MAKKTTPKMTCLLLTSTEEQALQFVVTKLGVFPGNRSQAIRHCIAQEYVRMSGGATNDTKYPDILDRVLSTVGVHGESGRGAEQAKAGIETKFAPFKLPPAGRLQLEKIQGNYQLKSLTAAIRAAIRVESLLAGFKLSAKGWV